MTGLEIALQTGRPTLYDTVTAQAITVPDQTIGPAISKLAADAGVVLIATDDSIKDSSGNAVPFVGFDGTEMGAKVGQAAADLLTKAGWLKDSSKKVGVLSVEVQTLSVCNDRTTAEKAAIQKAGVAASQVFAVPYTGETLSAQDAAGPPRDFVLSVISGPDKGRAFPITATSPRQHIGQGATCEIRLTDSTVSRQVKLS